MKIYTPIGSKERLFEMMKGVNKIELNESYSSGNVLEMAFNELKINQLEVEPQDTGDENIVNLLGTDSQGNTVSFTFHIEFTDSVQDNVFEVTEAKLISFAFDDAMGGESVEMGENELQQFNASHASDMIEIAGNYVDYNQVQVGQPEEIDELYEEAIKKIDSYPFGGTPERMQTSKAYGDEKPTNASVRVKSPELNKFEFVDEGMGIKPDVSNAGQKYFNKLDPEIKEMVITQAKQMIDAELAKNDMKYFDIPQEVYRAKIKELAVMQYERYLASLNEEETKEKKEKGDYPDQMGKKFKPKNQIPKKKKKPQTVVKLGEQYEEDDLGIPDFDIPTDVNAQKAAHGDMYKDNQNYNKGKEFDNWKTSVSYNTTFAEGYEEDDIDIPDLEIPVDKNAMKVAKSDIRKDTVIDNEPEADSDDSYDFVFNEEELSPEENPELTDAPESGEIDGDNKLQGGLADDKEPKDFDPEQLAMGLKVEMEHTDDPKLALEIAMDHLMEIPDYYTHLDKMEADAGVEDDDDAEMTDRLLGYEPKNVGDEIKLDEEDDLFARMGDIFRPSSGSNATGRKKHAVVFDGTSAYVEDINNVPTDAEVKAAYDNIDDAQAHADELNGEAGNISEASAGNKTKMFKIGEYAIGGIIKVDIDNKSGVQGGEVAISALDWNTKRPVQGTRFVATNINGIDEYLNELTSSYYAEMVMKWIKENTNAGANQNSYGW